MQVKWEFTADIQRTEQNNASRKFFPAWHANKSIDPQQVITVEEVLETGSTKPLKVQVCSTKLLLAQKKS